MNTKLLVVSVLLSGAVLTGCASSGKKLSSDATAPADTGMSTSGNSGYDSPIGRPVDSSMNGPDISQTIIYFEFDSADIGSEAQSIIANHAKYLTANPNTRVRLEGHTDERGTREYNVGLDERRASAVAQALELRGVSPQQVSVVSYGEERPVALGHDESAWTQNRRVEIVYP